MQLPRQTEPSLPPVPLLPQSQLVCYGWRTGQKDISIVANKEQFKILVSHPLQHLRFPPKMDVEIQMTKKKEEHKRQYAVGGRGIYLQGPEGNAILFLLSISQIQTPAKCNIEDLSSKLCPVWGNQNLQHSDTAGPPAGEKLDFGRKSST